MIHSRHPRRDHVAELTRGQILPFPSLAPIHLEIISETVSSAWQNLLNEYSSVLLTGNEAEITALLEARLNNLLDTEPLWRQLVSAVVRGKESLSFDGTHLEKRPDLSIYLTGRHPSFPFIIECKIIDIPAGKDASLYCGNGILRFINGEYAWANSDAMIVAYVRDDSSIGSHLIPHLQSCMLRSPDPWLTEELPSIIETLSDQARSVHGRSFEYVHTSNSKLPGRISLCHLWLSCKETAKSPTTKHSH